MRGKFRVGAACLLQPHYRFVGARLQQMHKPNHKIKLVDVGIARAEADDLLLERNYFRDRPGKKLAEGEPIQRI